MRATKIIHKGESRIKVGFPYNQEIASLIKQIADAKWSKTYGAWHIPYTSEAFNRLKSLFPEIEYPNKLSLEKNESVEKILMGHDSSKTTVPIAISDFL